MDSIGITLGSDLHEVIDAAGLSLDVGTPTKLLYRCGFGTLQVRRLSRVLSVSATGALLAHLRAVSLYDAYLWAISKAPFRITRIDAAIDLVTPAAPIISAVCLKARNKGVFLSRKSVRTKDVVQYLGEDDDGVLTGSAYLGSKLAEVRAVIYDKRKERIDKGFPDPGPLTRYEIRVRGQMGPTLRDAFDPTPLFFHFASPDLLPIPLGVPPWQSHAEGFTLDPIIQRTPIEKMFQLLELSPDVDRILALAHAAGPKGIDLLLSRIKRLHSQSSDSGAQHEVVSTVAPDLH